MKTLINWIINQLRGQLRRKNRFEATLGDAASVVFSGDGVRIKRGVVCVELSQAEYLMLLSLRGFQTRKGLEIEVAL